MAASTLHLLLIIALIIGFVVLVIYVLVHLFFIYLDEYGEQFLNDTNQNQDNHGKESTTGRNGESQKHN